MFESDFILQQVEQNNYKQHTRSTCPWCSDIRTKKRDRILSITIEDHVALYYCHHCTKNGAIQLPINVSSSTPSVSKSDTIKPYDNKLSDNVIKWLENRGIKNTTNVVSGTRWFRGTGCDVPAIGFKYINENDELVAIKWRALSSKDFRQEGPSSTMFMVSDIEEGDLIVTEGEVDALSFREAGYCAVSVPNGSPGPGGSIVNDEYLWALRDVLQAKIKRVLIATDSDEAGQRLADEISRRIGKYKCWKIVFPKGIKDGNELLIASGVDGLHKAVKDSQPWPIDGIHSPSEYTSSIVRLHANGFPRGSKLGVPAVDDLYNLAPSTLTILTGVPGTGKSTFLNWVMACLAVKHGNKFAIWSAEMPPEIIISNLCQLYQDKPFRGNDGMSPEELEEAIDWVNRHFVIIQTKDNTIDSIIEAAKASVLRYGVHGLIADPYNFINVPSDVRDENGLGKVKTILTKFKSLSMECALHTVLVAHPRKMNKDMNGDTLVPTGYDVSGSADFYNVPDIGLTIGKNKEGEPTLTNWKTRFPHLGKQGHSVMAYNKLTGAFGDRGTLPQMYVACVQPLAKPAIQQVLPSEDPWIN